jgi:uncharacterized protein (DUF952 family)
LEGDQLIYKIFKSEEWAGFETAGRFDGSEADRRDGFIHFSKADQLAGTLRRYYGAEQWVAVAAFPADAFDDSLKWEPSRGDDLFPHLYAPLLMTQLHSVKWIDPKAVC